MKDNSVNRVMLIASFIIFAIAMVFVTYYVTNYSDGSSKYFKNYNKIVKNELGIILEKQSKTDEKIKEISKDGDYTFDSPCILENPYGLNPLTALIIFNTNEPRSVTVKINDMQVTEVEKSSKHIIPIYGLYANSVNFIELVLDDGTSKIIEITTTSYNDNLEGITFKENETKATHKFVLGNLKSSNSLLRAFDSYDKLVSFIDFGYISSIRHNIDKYYIGYNSTYSKDTSLVDLNLEVDNMGRILTISKDTSELDYSYNAESGDKIYSYTYKNLYEEKIKNYSPTKRIDNEPYSVSSEYITKDLEEELVNAEVYEKEYKIGINGEYITYEFDEKNISLLLVTRNTSKSYLYNLKGKNIIKTNVFGDISLYVNIDNKYYTLLATVENS